VTTIFPGYTATNFASRVRKEDLRAQLEKSGEAFAMPPEAVAAAIAHAIDQPDGLNVAEIVMRSTGQPEEDARRLGCCSTNMLLYQHDERSEIDPQEHRLMIHGMVDRPLTFTMEDLKRLPSVTRLHFIECAGNRTSPKAKTVQETHGMTSCAEWTGVPLSLLLKECGLKGSASWFVAEGSEEVKGASSIPIGKGMDDCLVAYGMNGEALRPQQGFPLRLMVPGFEGIFHTKYLRRIKVTDRYYMNYNDYGHLDRESDEAALGFQIGPKSVITFPSGGQQLPGRGFYEIRGLAWSGGGAVRKVEVSTDGGKRWNDAEIKGTAQRMAHARFTYQWNWDGNETELLSRCTDELGSVQPSRAQVAKFFNKPLDESFSVPGLDNTIQPWRIASDGSVRNGNA
jgi:sulfane dehydrogenase subunit SoxC